MKSEKQKNSILKGVVLSGMIAGALPMAANANNLMSYNELGSGSELRSELLEQYSSPIDALSNVNGDYVIAEGKCGEGKCGEAKCGEEGKKETKKSEKKAVDAKTSEATCGDKDKKETKKEAKSKTTEAKCGENTCGGTE
ncbi:hypothetical protein E9993_10710 [Labilibacter sediminis]|nr:hypothetical protein E9993_10710 [Labilibacter sediminis]